MKILLFSPIRKNISILKVTIQSWLSLDMSGIQVDFLFYDDNDSKESINYLKSLESDNIRIVKFKTKSLDNYQGDHNWNYQQIDKISEIKNHALQEAIVRKYDSIFLVDADLVLHPNTLQSLLTANKDFIFEIFWTDFQKDGRFKPNCWDYHSWQYDNSNSIIQLKQKGIYKVGAGGACTLIKKELIEKGLSFNRIPNMRFNGEDRHISTRVYSLNSEIYVDTNYPAYHIHDIKKITEAQEWYNSGCKRDFFDNWLTADWMQLVKNSFSKPKTKVGKYKLALYKARRVFINTLKTNFQIL